MVLIWYTHNRPSLRSFSVSYNSSNVCFNNFRGGTNCCKRNQVLNWILGYLRFDQEVNCRLWPYEKSRKHNNKGWSLAHIQREVQSAKCTATVCTGALDAQLFQQIHLQHHKCIKLFWVNHKFISHSCFYFPNRWSHLAYFFNALKNVSYDIFLPLWNDLKWKMRNIIMVKL